MHVPKSEREAIDAGYGRTEDVGVTNAKNKKLRLWDLENKRRKKSNQISTTILTDARVSFL
jgi:hypothetical protein